MGNPSLDIILVNFNTDELVGRHVKRGMSGNRVVIDNSASLTQELVRGARVIKPSHNVGFTSGVNLGIKNADSKYILLLNPDCTLKAGAIGHLVDVFERDLQAGVALPKLMYPDGSLQLSVRRWPTVMTVLARGFGLTEHRSWMPKFMRSFMMVDVDHAVSREVDWGLGACMMLRRSMLDQIGLLDERYWMYYSDVEICWRAKQNGWKVWYEPRAVAVHEYQRSSARGGIFNSLKWSHLTSALRFIWTKNKDKFANHD